MVLALRRVFFTNRNKTTAFALYITDWFYNRGGKCLQRGTD
jgi:hypothetical protein